MGSILASHELMSRHHTDLSESLSTLDLEQSRPQFPLANADFKSDFFGQFDVN
jgi:hypothetical protein